MSQLCKAIYLMHFIATALLVVHALGNNITLWVLSPDFDEIEPHYEYSVPKHIAGLSEVVSELVQDCTDDEQWAVPISIDEHQFDFPRETIIKILQHLFPAKLTPADVDLLPQTEKLSDEQKIAIASRPGSGGISLKSADLESSHYLSADMYQAEHTISDTATWVITNLYRSDQNVSIFSLRNVATNKWLRFVDDGYTLDCAGGQPGHAGGVGTSLRVHHAQSNRFKIQSPYWWDRRIGLRRFAAMDQNGCSARTFWSRNRWCTFVPVYHFIQRVYDLFLYGNGETPFTDSLQLTSQIFRVSHFLKHSIGLSLSKNRILEHLNSGGATGAFKYEWLDGWYGSIWDDEFFPFMTLKAKLDVLPHLVNISHDGKVRPFDIEDQEFKQLDNVRLQICLRCIGSGAFEDYNIFKFGTIQNPTSTSRYPREQETSNLWT
eukprot:205562_1